MEQDKCEICDSIATIGVIGLEDKVITSRSYCDPCYNKRYKNRKYKDPLIDDATAQSTDKKGK